MFNYVCVKCHLDVSWVQPSLEILTARVHRKYHGMRHNSSDVHPLFQDSRGREQHSSGNNNRTSLLTEEASQLRRNKFEEPEADRQKSLEAICGSRKYTGLDQRKVRF